MFDLFHWFFPDTTSVGSIGDYHNHCSMDLPAKYGTTIEQFHQGIISVPKSDLFAGSDIKTLNPVHFPKHTPPAILSPEGPSVNSTTKGKIFSFTARVDPDSSIIDGVRIDWSGPPDAARILVSPTEKSNWHDATGWISTKANGRFAGGIPQSQNIIFSQPEQVKRIEIQMRDSTESTKTQFGIDQVGLVTHAGQVINR